MSRRGLLAALVLIGVCVTSGCDSSTGPKAAAPSPATSIGPGGTPDALVGSWQVVGAPGEPAGTVLRLSAGEGLGLILFRRCGELFGSWAAGPGGTFLGLVDGWSQGCNSAVPGSKATPAWLAHVHTFRVSGAERRLVATDGTVVARLLPGRPRPVTDIIQSLQDEPTIDPATAQRLRKAPQPLPKGAAPATPDALVGTWTPEPRASSASGKPPFAKFLADGSWQTYDGCNGGGGRWAVGAAGEFLVTTGASAGVGCAGPITHIRLDQARRAAVTGDVLTLYDSAGRVVARLRR